MKYPKDSFLLFQYNYLEALSLFEIKKYNESIVLFKKALRYKDEKSSKLNIGMAYFNLKSYTEAIPFYTELIEKKAFNNGNAEFYRGFCYLQLGQKDNACADFKSASALGYGVNPAFMVGCK